MRKEKKVIAVAPGSLEERVARLEANPARPHHGLLRIGNLPIGWHKIPARYRYGL